MSVKMARGCKSLLKALNLLQAGRRCRDSHDIVSEDPCPAPRGKFCQESPRPFNCQGHLRAELCPPSTTEIREENENVLWCYTVIVSSPHSALLLGKPRFPLSKSSCQKYQHKLRNTVPVVFETELDAWFQTTQIKAEEFHRPLFSDHPDVPWLLCYLKIKVKNVRLQKYRKC